MKSRFGAFLRELRTGAGARFWWTIALASVCSLSEGFGLALILPTLAVAGFNLGAQGNADRYATFVRQMIAKTGLKPDLLIMLTLLVIVIGARALLDRGREISLWTVQQNFEDMLRRRLYKAIVSANWLFITRNRFTDFNHALTAEISRIGDAVLFTLTFAADIALGLLYLFTALALSAPTSAVVIAAACMLVFALRRKSRHVQRHGAELAAVTNQLYAAASDHLQGLKTARTYDAPERNLALFADLSGRIAATNLAAVREQASAALWFQLGAVLLLFPTLYLALRVFAVPPASLLILLLVFVRVMPRFQWSHRNYQNLLKSLPSFANVIALENRCRAAAEPPPDGSDVPPLRREISLAGASFSYQEGAFPALREVSLTIPAGRVTAIVGPSGAGKSTIVDLIMGLLTAEAGAVMIDGVPLSPASSHAWRRRIGYAANETVLFHLTIRENLLWARPGATEAELWEALQVTAADHFVRALPRQLDTTIGDRGLTLSQGERQRIALARALLRRPSLLILDEATNSLDYANETMVLDALATHQANLTILTVAHRLSAIRRASLIHVIEDGRLAESGSWEELNVRPGGRFRALCEAHRIEV